MTITLLRAAITRSLMRWTAMLLLGQCCLCTGLFAQEETVQESSNESAISEAEEPGFETPLDSNMNNPRNPVGFSFGFDEMYSSNTIPGDSGREAAIISAIEPRIFMNAGRRRSRLHAELQGAYRLYKDHSNMNSAEVNGNISYTYQAGRQTNIQIADTVSSRNEDIYSYADYMPFIFTGYPISSYTLLQNRQRITENDLEGRIEFKPGRKDTVAVFGRYEIYRDGQTVDESVSSDGILAGVNYEHRFASWAYFNAAWSTYLNNVDTKYRDSKIYRLEVGGFHFKLGQAWSLSTWSGVDILDTKGYSRRIDAAVRALLIHRSNTNSQYLSFQRGYAAANGTAGQVLQSYIIRGGLGQRLTNWLLFTMSGSYFIGRESLENRALEEPNISTIGKLRSYDIRTSLEFSILKNLQAILEYRYQNQDNTFSNITGVVKFDRYIASVGLQYFWPHSEH
jgi:hypothetical protein